MAAAGTSSISHAVKWLPGECAAKTSTTLCCGYYLTSFWKGVWYSYTKQWSTFCCLAGRSDGIDTHTLQELQSNLRWPNGWLWFLFYHFFHFCRRQSTTYLPTWQSADACLKCKGMLKYYEDDNFFLTSSTLWFSILRTNINGSTCVSYSCAKEPAVEDTEDLGFASIDKVVGIFLFMDLGSLFGIPQCGGTFSGVQVEILMWRSSLRPWLGHTAYGSFAHHAQPTHAATNIQPTAHLLVHGCGAPLRLLACHFFVPMCGRRFLPLSMCSSGFVLVLPEAGSQWQFGYFFYYLGPMDSLYTSVLSST